MRRMETKPRKVNEALTFTIREIARDLLANSGQQVKPGLGIYCVNQRKGMYWGRKNYITIPAWAMDRGLSYVKYYVAHELSHAVVDYKYPSIRVVHGDLFMQTFKIICPVELQYHECRYKPQAAKRNGVAKNI